MIVSHFYPEGSIVEAKNNYLTLLELEKNGFQVDVCTFESEKEYSKNVKYTISKKNKIFSIKNRYYNFFRTKIKMPLLPIEFNYVKDFLNVIDQIDIDQYGYIYTVFGNGSEHLVGVHLKQYYPHLKHIAEFRDPWVHNRIAKDYFYDKAFKFYANYYWKSLESLEYKLVSKVDLLLVESALHGSLIKKDFNYEREILVCNGYSNLFLEKELELDLEFTSKPIIGFIGSTYYGYEDVAKTFIEVLEELEEEGMTFSFISVGDNFFSKQGQFSQLKNFYPFQKVSYIKALSFMKKIDVGLAMTMESYPNHVNSKIFEHMQYKKFTLAIAPKDGAMDMLLSKTKTGKVLSYSKEDMKKELRTFLKDSKNSTLDMEQIKEFNREEVFKPIIKAIKEL